MRKLLSVAGALGLASFIAAPSFAASLPLNASVQVQIATLPPPTISGTTGVGTAMSVGGGIATIPAGVLVNTAAINISINPPFVGLVAVTAPANSISNPAGSFSPNGAMGLNGDTFFLTEMGANAGGVPLAPIGGGGMTSASIAGLALTINGATWMGGTQVFTFMGGAAAIPIVATATSFDNRTANGAGTVQLVAPATADLGILGALPVFGVLTLEYAPEPGYLLLLGAGALTLMLAGRRKLQR